jgi:hypothetical protein
MNVTSAIKIPSPVPSRFLRLDGAYDLSIIKRVKHEMKMNVPKRKETIRKVTNERMLRTPTQLFRATQ